MPATAQVGAQPAAGCDDGKHPCCDIDCDQMKLLYQQEIEMDQALTGETSANVEANGGLWRSTQNRKFAEVNAVEAAATETILNGTRRNA